MFIQNIWHSKINSKRFFQWSLFSGLMKIFEWFLEINLENLIAANITEYLQYASNFAYSSYPHYPEMCYYSHFIHGRMVRKRNLPDITVARGGRVRAQTLDCLSPE